VTHVTNICGQQNFPKEEVIIMERFNRNRIVTNTDPLAGILIRFLEQRMESETHRFSQPDQIPNSGH